MRYPKKPDDLVIEATQRMEIRAFFTTLLAYLVIIGIIVCL